MAKKVKVKLNWKEVGKLLRSQEMMNICKEHASEVLNKCPAGYEMTTHVGQQRVNASVIATTYQAKADNMRNNTLLKAVGK